ncbi:glycosyltransferase [Bacillus sp. JJ1521]|uniref:glycosyltransferase family 2 protein n=1 Tax=Bacillus sp. JJ1521 TaxID=3122957 RepID=UPI0030006FB1
MLQKDLVSIVVPIYKVEKYLNRCIETIINQTYKNIEIILVDDGSPDNCGAMAEEYAQLDNRIIVIHKKNGGLSDARNIGIKYVTGDFTIFVDSDDWLEKNMIEELVNISRKHKADVVQSAFYYAYEDYLLFDDRYYKKDDPPIILGNKALMAELVLNERIKNFAWGKLYKTKIIKDIPFKKGVLFEDVFWAHNVMHLVNTYVIVHQPLYFYLQRSDSIVSTYTHRNLDILEGLKERHYFIEQYYPELTNESYKVILKNSLIHYNLLLMNRKKDKSSLHKRKIQAYIVDHYNEFQIAVKGDKQLDLQLRFFAIHPYFNICLPFIRKVLRKCKMLSKPIGLERINVKTKGDLINEEAS